MNSYYKKKQLKNWNLQFLETLIEYKYECTLMNKQQQMKYEWKEQQFTRSKQHNWITLLQLQ